ncbi:MAG: DUF2877 domain-containing protein [Alphaproteobacteria bacterium]
MTTQALDASAVGILAAETLEHATQATVLAVFERSFYLDTGDDLVAVIANDLPDGPLNLRVPGLSAAGIACGQRWTLTPLLLQSGTGLAIDLAKATVWAPDAAPPLDRQALAYGLDILLSNLVTLNLPSDGLIRLALHSATPATPVEQAAAAPLARLTTALGQSFQGESATFDSVEQLIGLGPGLTPSGDDLLAGALITCHHLGEIESAQPLAAAVCAVAAATNRISQAHLQAAARGYVAAPLHDLLHASLTTGRRSLRQDLDVAGKIGHSSGLDALAGIILTLRTWLAAASG